MVDPSPCSFIVTQLYSLFRCPVFREHYTSTINHQPSTIALSLDTIQVLDAAEEEGAVGDGGGGPEHFLLEAVLRHDFELRTGFEHERLAVLVQAEDLAVVGPGGGG